MSEAITKPVPNAAPLQEMLAENLISEARFKREEFGLGLVNEGLVSSEFYVSGAMDKFELDERTGKDTLIHMLVGDQRGGGHHLPTSMALESKGSAVASVIADPKEPHRSLTDFRSEQQVRHSGAYRALHVEVPDSRTGRPLKKVGGSSMFPNDWTTEKVLSSVIRVAGAPGRYDEKRRSYTHHK